MGNIAVFLDRDGTVNEEVDFLTSPDELHLIPRAAEAIRAANRLGLRVIILTNQSGIARGMLSEENLNRIHASLTEQLLAHEATVDRIYYCPHHPTVGNGAYRRDCDCRKPKTGMMLRAAREFGIDLRRSFVVGDRCIDIGMAKNAGAKSILVLTGYGKAELEICGREGCTPDHVADDLLGAVEYISTLIAQGAERGTPRTP